MGLGLGLESRTPSQLGKPATSYFIVRHTCVRTYTHRGMHTHIYTHMHPSCSKSCTYGQLSGVILVHPASMTLSMVFPLLKPLSWLFLIHFPVSAQGPPPPRSLPGTLPPAGPQSRLCKQLPLTAIARGAILSSLYLHFPQWLGSSFQTGPRLSVSHALTTECLLNESASE